MKRATTKIKKEKVIYKVKPYEELSEQDKADTNLLFHLPDMAELLAILMKERAKKDNCELKKGTINQLTKVIEQFRKFRERTKRLTLEQQTAFGETSDALIDILRVIYIVTSGNPKSIEILTESIKKAFSEEEQK